VLSVRPCWHTINLDALTCAGHPANLINFPPDHAGRYKFIHGYIEEVALLERLFSKDNLDSVVHFAVEPHVDRLIPGPKAFVQTNVLGTFCLLEAIPKCWNAVGRPDTFHFINIPTDEVFDSLGPHGYFTEETPYDPSSPYSASNPLLTTFLRSISYLRSANNHNQVQFAYILL